MKMNSSFPVSEMIIRRITDETRSVIDSCRSIPIDRFLSINGNRSIPVDRRRDGEMATFEPVFVASNRFFVGRFGGRLFRAWSRDFGLRGHVTWVFGVT